MPWRIAPTLGRWHDNTRHGVVVEEWPPRRREAREDRRCDRHLDRAEEIWRRGWDSNPRRLAPYGISSAASSLARRHPPTSACPVWGVSKPFFGPSDNGPPFADIRRSPQSRGVYCQIYCHSGPGIEAFPPAPMPELCLACDRGLGILHPPSARVSLDVETTANA
jgi:hypothetical protein